MSLDEELLKSVPMKPAEPRWRGMLGYLGGALLGAIFLLGAFTKAPDPMAFQEMIKLEGLAGILPAGVVAMIAFGLEAGLGSALVLGLRRLWILIPSTALVAFFLFLTGRAYYKFANGIVDESGAGCGCFGNLVDRTPSEAFWQDFLLMVPALLMAFLGWRKSGSGMAMRLGIVAVVTLATLGFVWKAPGLPIDDFATRLKPGKMVADFCTGKGDEQLCLTTLVPELETGEHLVVIADLDEPFGETVVGINDYINTGNSVVVLSSAEPEDHHAFFWQWAPSFDIKEVPVPMMKPLYRTLPRSFRVKDGSVTETFAGLPAFPGNSELSATVVPETNEDPQDG